MEKTVTQPVSVRPTLYKAVNRLRVEKDLSWNEAFKELIPKTYHVTSNDDLIIKNKGVVPSMGGYTLKTGNKKPSRELVKPRSIPVSNELFSEVKAFRSKAHLSWNDVFLWTGAALEELK